MKNMIVEDYSGKKYPATRIVLDDIKHPYNDKVTLTVAVDQANMDTPWDDRLLTTLWAFPHKQKYVCGKGHVPFGPKKVIVGSTMLNVTDTFNYKQAFINAFIDLGRNILMNDLLHNDKAAEALLNSKKNNNERVTAHIARWARHVVRKMYRDYGDADEGAIPLIEKLNEKKSEDAGTSFADTLATLSQAILTAMGADVAGEVGPERPDLPDSLFDFDTDLPKS